jgi:hypothetical protein
VSHVPLAVTFYADHDQHQLAYDVLILLIIVINVAAGIRQGLIRRSISLAGVFGGAAAATWVGNSAVNLVSHNGLFQNAWSFLTIFLLVTVMIEILSVLYRDQIEQTTTLMFDRTAGALMGLAVGVLQVSLLIVLALAVGDAQPGPGRDVPANHTGMAADIRTATLGSLFVQADSGLRSVFTPVLPQDFPDHLAQSSN